MSLPVCLKIKSKLPRSDTLRQSSCTKQSKLYRSPNSAILSRSLLFRSSSVNTLAFSFLFSIARCCSKKRSRSDKPSCLLLFERLAWVDFVPSLDGEPGELSCESGRLPGGDRVFAESCFFDVNECCFFDQSKILDLFSSHTDSHFSHMYDQPSSNLSSSHCFIPLFHSSPKIAVPTPSFCAFHHKFNLKSVPRKKSQKFLNTSLSLNHLSLTS